MATEIADTAVSYVYQQYWRPRGSACLDSVERRH